MRGFGRRRCVAAMVMLLVNRVISPLAGEAAVRRGAFDADQRSSSRAFAARE